MVKHFPAMRETWVRSLGLEDPLEKELATHSTILAWKIPWIEKPGRLQSMGSKESDTTEHTSTQPCYRKLFLFPSVLLLRICLDDGPSEPMK